MVGNVIEVETLLRQANGAPLVRRLIAPNPSPMTERGTNSYLIGWREPAVIDPGPDAAAHLGALAAVAAHGAERAAPMRIVVTHTHLDHSAGAAALAKRLNARAFAYGAHDDGRSELQRRVADQVSGIGGGEGADRRFSPDAKLADGEALAADTGEWRLEALHTPGHLSNHLCFALRDAVGRPAALFSGDLVMAWSTSLISPPDGDMGAFMASLERLAARLETPGADPVYLPGHGAPIEAP
ncbi:MAG: MBL fold metallo-hydrolase, partial [Pseudomonadota bacterium]